MVETSTCVFLLCTQNTGKLSEICSYLPPTPPQKKEMKGEKLNEGLYSFHVVRPDSNFFHYLSAFYQQPIHFLIEKE